MQHIYISDSYFKGITYGKVFKILHQCKILIHIKYIVLKTNTNFKSIKVWKEMKTRKNTTKQ